MPWFRIALAAAIAFAAWWVASNYIKGREDRARNAGRAEIQAKWDKAEAQRREVADKAEKESRARERAMQEKANVAISTAAKRASVARADADLARSELDRLRAVPAHPIGADSGRSTETACRASDDRTGAVRELLNECASAYQELAGKAGAHLIDALSAREAWPQ